MDSLRVETDERGVARLILDRRERHNALDRALIDALRDALEGLGGDTRVLLLEARGGSFCAGADLDWMRASVTLSTEENAADAKAMSDLLHALDTFPHPSVARVQGAALGGGAGLVACCDVAIADETALFAFSEVRLGLIPATISPYVVAAIGTRAARRYFLSAERFDAAEARRIGLVHESCPGDALDGRVAATIEALLTGGPRAQRATKNLLREVVGRPSDESLRLETARRLAEIRTGDEAQEGLAAFLEKRRPAWREG